MERHLPGEAHAPVHLNGGPGVGDGRLVGQHLGPRDAALEQLAPGAAGHGGLRRGDVGRVGQAGRGVHRGPGHLGAHQHVGAHVLDGLEAADRLAELLAFLGVGHGEVEHRRGVPDLERRREHGAGAPEVATVVGQGAAEGERVEPPHRGERVQGVGQVARPAARAPGPAAGAGRRRRGRAGRRGSPGVRPGPGRAARRRACRPGPVPSAAPSTAPATAARKVPTSGPGTRARPSSSKTTVASARPRPVPSGSGRVREKTPVSPRACQSAASATRSAPSRVRTRSSGSRPATRERMPSASSRWSSPTRKSISAPWAGRGCARPRCCAAPARCPPRW